MKLRIGHLSTLYHTSILVMARKDLLKGFPAEIEWKLFGTGPAIVDAFEKDRIDIAYVGLPPAIIGIERGISIKCVSGGHVEGTVIASGESARGYPDLENPAEVLSQFSAIGVPGRGSIHDLIVMDTLKAGGSPVKVRNFTWADEVLEEFVRGSVEAVVGTPALAQAVIRFAGGKIVYPPHLLWPDNPSYGILVKEDLLAEAPGLLKEFLTRHERANKVLREEKEEAAEQIANFMAVVDKQFVLDALNISPRYCSALTEGYIQCTMSLAERMNALGYIKKSIAMDDVFELSLIRDVHPEPDHYRE